MEKKIVKYTKGPVLAGTKILDFLPSPAEFKKVPIRIISKNSIRIIYPHKDNNSAQ